MVPASQRQPDGAESLACAPLVTRPHSDKHHPPMLRQVTKPQTASVTKADQSQSDEIRVLVVFGAVPLYGQERATVRLFEAVRELGVKAKFLINADYGHLSVAPELNRLGFEHAPAPYGPLIGSRWTVRQLWQFARGVAGTNWALWREIRRFEPTHLFVMNPAFILYTSPAIFLSRLPLVYRIGDAPPVHSRAHRALWHLVTRRIDLLVTNADYVARLCREAGFPAQKIRRIYSAAREAKPRAACPVRLYVTRYEVPHRHEEIVIRPEPECLTAIFVGQLTPNKGFDLAVAAAEKLVKAGCPFRLLIAGDYCYQRPQALATKQRIQREGLSDRIKFLGYVKNIGDLLALADVHLCPSLWEEPLSNTVLEAKSAGIPSIIFPRGGLAETIRHGVDGWVCSRQTAEGLEEALQYYLDHPAERSKHGTAARESATGEGQFGWDRSATEWLSAFRDEAQPVQRQGGSGWLAWFRPARPTCDGE